MAGVGVREVHRTKCRRQDEGTSKSRYDLASHELPYLVAFLSLSARKAEEAIKHLFLLNAATP
jgi:hypothetical protein